MGLVQKWLLRNLLKRRVGFKDREQGAGTPGDGERQGDQNTVRGMWGYRGEAEGESAPGGRLTG